MDDADSIGLIHLLERIAALRFSRRLDDQLRFGGLAFWIRANRSSRFARCCVLDKAAGFNLTIVRAYRKEGKTTDLKPGRRAPTRAGLDRALRDASEDDQSGGWQDQHHPCGVLAHHLETGVTLPPQHPMRSSSASTCVLRGKTREVATRARRSISVCIVLSPGDRRHHTLRVPVRFRLDIGKKTPHR